MNKNESSTKLQNFEYPHLELDLGKRLYTTYKGNKVFEIWKDIPNFKGSYQCSNFGRVKSLERKVKNKNGFRISPQRILKQALNKGYPQVGLKQTPIDVKRQVHQLVAICFLNHTPCAYEVVVDHKDNVKINNFYKNLQLTTNRANVSKDMKKGMSKYRGVSFNKGKWRALILHDGKRIHLGLFDTQEKASEYYQNALKSIKENKPINIKRRKQTSKHLGIYKSGNKWALTLSRKYYGTFETEQEALTFKNKILCQRD